MNQINVNFVKCAKIKIAVLAKFCESAKKINVPEMAKRGSRDYAFPPLHPCAIASEEINKKIYI